MADVLVLLSHAFESSDLQLPTHHQVESAISFVLSEGFYCDSSDAWVELGAAVAQILKCEESQIASFKSLFISSIQNAQGPCHEQQDSYIPKQRSSSFNDTNNNEPVSQPDETDPSSQGLTASSSSLNSSIGGTSDDDGLIAQPNHEQMNPVQVQFQKMFRMVSSDIRACEDRVMNTLASLENRITTVENHIASNGMYQNPYNNMQGGMVLQRPNGYSGDQSDYNLPTKYPKF